MWEADIERIVALFQPGEKVCETPPPPISTKVAEHVISATEGITNRRIKVLASLGEK
jgi:hypothetical protein